MNANDLLPFCSTDELRENLLKPFSVGEFTYATDGRIAVRVPRLPDVGEIEKPVGVERLFREGYKPTAPAHEIPELTFRDLECKMCEGNGKIRKCYDCDGEGERECDMGHTHKCDTCDGDGGFASDSEKGEPCFKCGGTGKIPDAIGVGIGVGTFSNLLLAKIRGLPECKMHVESNTSVATFTFNGGGGLLMPMRA